MSLEHVYKRLRADERFRASVEALSRGDWVELRRLQDTAEPVAVSIPSPAYLERLQAFELASLTHGIAVRDALMRLILLLTDGTSDESRSTPIAKAAAALQAMQLAWASFCGELGVAPEGIEAARYAEMSAFLQALGPVESADSGPHLQVLRAIWRARLARVAGLA